MSTTPPRPAGAAAHSGRGQAAPMLQASGDWIMNHGSRAQRRDGLRQLKALARQGDPESVAMLAELRRAGQ